MAITATDAAFEGFRIAREKPLAIVIWAVVAMAIAAITAVALVLTVGPDMAELTAASQAGSSDPEAVMALMPKFLKLYAVILPLGLLGLALFTCAVYRTVLRPDDRGLGYLKLSGDELRMVLLFIILGLLGFLALMGASAVIGVLAGVLGAAAPGASAAVFVLGLIAFVMTILWIGVRLSLAGPMTFTEGRLVVFGSWKVTRGRFWFLFGTYLLAFVMGLIVSLLGLVIYLAVASAATGGFAAASQALTQPDMSSLEAYFTPAMIIYLLFSGVLSALYYAIAYAPAAVVWRDLRDGQGASVFD